MKQIQKDLKKRKRAILEILNSPRRVYSTETFHRVRLEIKKLRALFELLNASNENFDKTKTFAPFRKLFKEAGRIRDIEIEQQLILAYGKGLKTSVYCRSLRIEKLKQTEVYFLMVNVKLISKIKKKLKVAEDASRTCEIDPLNNYLEKKRQTIAEIINKKKVQPEQIHTLRKYLKSYVHNRNLITRKKKDQKSNLQKLVGEWNDRVVAIKHIQRAQLNVITAPSELIQLKNLKQQLSLDRDKLFSRICIAMRKSEFYSSDQRKSNGKSKTRS